MRHLFGLLFFAALSVSVVSAQDSLTIETKKLHGMVQDIKKKQLLEQKLLYSEQQVRSFLNMDSLYTDLRVDFVSTITSQQETIKDLVRINEGSSLIVSGIREELKDVRLNFYNDNINLRTQNEKLRQSNSNKTKIIVALSATLATIVTALAL